METNENNTKYAKGTYFFTMIIAGCSALTFLVLLICALVVVPKAVGLMGTAQTTLDNLQTVTENLMELNLSETVQGINDNTTRAMQDVSDSMNRIENIDIESLNSAIKDLGESVENLNRIFSYE